MRFEPAGLSGVFLIELTPASDPRGSSARTYCEREFEEHGLNGRFVQCNLSHNAMRGTLRGMHFQRALKWTNPHLALRVLFSLRERMR